MRSMTNEELALWRKAHEVLPMPIEPGTNVTALSYILDGKAKELEELIRATQEIKCQEQ